MVAENNFAQCDGKKVADAFFLESALEGFCVIEPRQGNCFAINCAFGTALRAYPQAPYLLMIDDDETATPGWIEEMVQAARLHKSDLVGGPVLRAFEGDATPAIRSHPIFGDYLRPSGFVASLWGSGNCLIGRQVFEALGEPSFDMRFNFLGGGDMEFFTRCKRLGFKAYWNSNAVAIETVPAQRTELAWMLKRSVVIGVINYTIDRKGRRPRRDIFFYGPRISSRWESPCVGPRSFMRKPAISCPRRFRCACRSAAFMRPWDFRRRLTKPEASNLTGA